MRQYIVQVVDSTMHMYVHVQSPETSLSKQAGCKSILAVKTMYTINCRGVTNLIRQHIQNMTRELLS